MLVVLLVLLDLLHTHYKPTRVCWTDLVFVQLTSRVHLHHPPLPLPLPRCSTPTTRHGRRSLSCASLSTCRGLRSTLTFTKRWDHVYLARNLSLHFLAHYYWVHLFDFQSAVVSSSLSTPKLQSRCHNHYFCCCLLLSPQSSYTSSLSSTYAYDNFAQHSPPSYPPLRPSWCAAFFPEIRFRETTR